MSQRSKRPTTARRCKARGHLWYDWRGVHSRCPYCPRARVSTATPTEQDRELIAPIIAGFQYGALDRRDYWHLSQFDLLAAHPEFSGHDATRVARILAPFPLQDDRYAPR